MDIINNDASLSTVTLFLLATLAFLTYWIVIRNKSYEQGKKLPPHIPSTIPYLGHAVNFGRSPVEFLLLAYQKYGPVFSFTMVGKTFTYLIGPESCPLFFNSKNQDLNAEDVYSKLTTPVFGNGVAYDVPNEVFLEQKKMLKSGLNIANFKKHIPIIIKETEEYFERWGNEGVKDLFVAFSELIILTASSCLHGHEIRQILNERVAQLYWDLDGGFSHEAWLLPTWVPLPSFRKRDQAHREIKKLFYTAISERRRQGEDAEDDTLQSLINARYKDGRALTDDEIAGMLIGLLLAGQHTSSTTSSWLGFFIAQNTKYQNALYDEQMRVIQEGRNLDYDGLKNCCLLEACVKETLRLRPPIMTMMRMCKTEQKVLGYTIPSGHQICVSPTTNQKLPDIWHDPETFYPERFMDGSGLASEDKFAYIPFGAGRHRCIGESFAYVQIKTIWSTLIRKFEFQLVDNYFPEINYATMIHTPLKPLIKYKKRLTN